MIPKKKVFVALTNDVSSDQRVHKVSSYLVEKGFDVLVYGRVLPTTFEVERPYNIERKKLWFNHNFLFYAEYNCRLFWKLLFYKCDYILANDLDTLPACFMASKFKKSALVYDSHELFSEGPELQGRHFVRGFWKGVERLLLPRLKRTFTVSNSIASYYNKKHGVRMGVVRNVPFLDKKVEATEVVFPTKNKTVLYQGILNPGRGLIPMIKSLHFLKKVDLVIIGYGKVIQELHDLVHTERLTSRVHFLGRVPHEELPNYTNKATIGMVLEEPLGLSFEYALPNKLFDYIHAELPLISGVLPEISAIVSKYKVGVQVANYHPETIAEAVRSLLENKALYQEIKENQQQVKKDFCWEKEKQLLDPYFS